MAREPRAAEALTAWPRGRRSYRGLLSLPAWGLYSDGKLVATVRARTAVEARDLFGRHGLDGDRVRRIP